MTSQIAKTGAATASTSTLQPTNAAQANGLASLITSTAAPALTALGSPHAPGTLSEAQSVLRLQEDVKMSSDIDKLVVSGKTTTSAASAVAATQTQASERLMVDVSLESALKISSEVGILVELGKTGGTTQVPKEKIKASILQKISGLRDSAKFF